MSRNSEAVMTGVVNMSHVSQDVFPTDWHEKRAGQVPLPPDPVHPRRRHDRDRKDVITTIIGHRLSPTSSPGKEIIEYRRQERRKEGTGEKREGELHPASASITKQAARLLLHRCLSRIFHSSQKSLLLTEKIELS